MVFWNVFLFSLPPFAQLMISQQEVDMDKGVRKIGGSHRFAQTKCFVPTIQSQSALKKPIQLSIL